MNPSQGGAVRSRLSPSRSDAGVTLIELLVTVAILGIAFVAIVGGMMTSIVGSDLHRKQATSETVLRSYAEAAKAQTSWTGCSATTATYSPAAVGLTVPSGYSASATAVQFGSTTLTGASYTTTWGGSGTCTGDTAPQLITLQVRSTDGRATESLEVIRRQP